MNKVVKNYLYIISSLIMFVLTYLLARYLSPSIINTFICVMAGGVVYLGLLFVMKDETLFEAADKIKGKFLKK